MKDSFPFPSLDFPGRKALTYEEVAERLQCTSRHIRELVEEGRLAAVDISGVGNISNRKTRRIPVETYRQFLLASLSTGFAASAIRYLTSDELTRVSREIQEHLTRENQP